MTWLQIGSLLVKVPLSIWFAFGGLGLEAQGAVGCAWATLVVHLPMLALALWLLRTRAAVSPLPSLASAWTTRTGTSLAAFARVWEYPAA